MDYISLPHTWVDRDFCLKVKTKTNQVKLWVTLIRDTIIWISKKYYIWILLKRLEKFSLFVIKDKFILPFT